MNDRTVPRIATALVYGNVSDARALLAAEPEPTRAALDLVAWLIGYGDSPCKAIDRTKQLLP